ncbi:hypothetical protein DL770_011707 [Monosporascus sp. CRB-9-2]|nr:hypothetical protein DL770_011707 [Monosporascus sp. CRB-9-2]
MAAAAHAEAEQQEARPPRESGHKWRILSIVIVLSALTLNSGMDATIVTTSLLTITGEIGGASEYVWVAQSYLFGCSVPQPFYGQIANIFRRHIALGSGIAGGARNVPTLIAGRVVQGLGTGGINVLPEFLFAT